MIWRCPEDRAPLVQESAQLTCTRCERRFEFVDGVARFGAQDATIATDSAKLDELAELDREITDSGVAAGARAFCRDRACWWRRYTVDLKFFVPNPSGGRVLELGAGFGDDSLSLSQRASSVVSLVPNTINGRIVGAHVRDRGVDNVEVAVVSDLSRLPLADDSVSAIVMEEIAASAFDSSAGFERWAADFARVLEPSGTICFGLQHRLRRLGQRWLGAHRLQVEPSLNRYLKQQAAGNGHRFTGGFHKLEEQLQALGFATASRFAPLPHEDDIEIIIPADDPQVARYCLNYLLRQNSLWMRGAIQVANAAVRLGLLSRMLPYTFVNLRRLGQG